MTASYITGVIRRETQFDCLAKDAYGNQATVTFTVSPQDAIVASAVGESSVEAAPGSDVEMVVEATGSGALSYAWYKVVSYTKDIAYYCDGETNTSIQRNYSLIPGATGASYTAERVNRETEYRCLVSDGYGNSAEVFFKEIPRN